MLPTAATVRNGSAKASSAAIPKPQVSIETITQGDTETGEESGSGSEGVVWGVRCEMD
jgi:hypothetical protein